MRVRPAASRQLFFSRPLTWVLRLPSSSDPTFRSVFYEEILPDLKRQGKALIVISHDDRFFGVADRRVLLQDGKQVTA